MELTLEQYERIQKYSDGVMTAGEQEAFLLELETNSEMRHYLDLELAIMGNLSLTDPSTPVPSELKGKSRFDDPDFIKSLINKVDKNRQTEKNNIITLWPYIAVAAGIILAVSIILWRQNDSSTNIADKKKDTHQPNKANIQKSVNNDSAINNKPEHQINYAGLYKKFYQKDNLPEEVPELLADAFLDYKDNDYRKLQLLDLQNLPRSRGGPPYDQPGRQHIRELGHYYKAIAYIETQNDEEALFHLNWVADNANNKNLKGKAQWYLALILIKRGNKTNAISILEGIAANANLKPYNSKAKDLLRLLQKSSEAKQ